MISLWDIRKNKKELALTMASRKALFDLASGRKPGDRFGAERALEVNYAATVRPDLVEEYNNNGGYLVP